MNLFTAYLAAIHLRELREEAELARRAKLARKAQATLPAWRRGLGGILASAATVADPCIELVNARRARDESGARAFAA